MNRVTKRTWLMGLFVIMLLGGILFFVWEYFTQARTWVMFPGSPHVYNNGNIGCGTVVDRDGVILLSIGDGRQYSDNEMTRKSTLHWLGDRKGSISAGAIANYASQMSGFDMVNGLYNYSDIPSTASLTISARVQNAALAALGSQKGTVGVYNYKTGEIICAVTAPTYDPDNVPDMSDDPEGAFEGVYVNRFLQSRYVPGSIFKIVTAAIALETVPDIQNRTFTCYGEYDYGSETEKVTCETAHVTLDLEGALAHSCNCCFAQIAKLIGRKNMTKYVSKYEVMEPIRFDGVKSAAGNYDNSNTGGVSFAWSCIGQHTDLVNPCGFMTFMGTIASGGQGVYPYLVSGIETDEGVVYEAKMRKTSSIMDGEIARTIRSYMRHNVQEIYGDENFPGLSVCAKSGTSQLGGNQKSNAMFAGFVENEEYPFAFMIVVENGGYGSAACVPILSKVLAECKKMVDEK